MGSYRSIFNYVGTQAGWFACALGASRGFPWVGVLFAALYLPIHLWGAAQPKHEVRYLIVAGLVGAGADSLLKMTGVVTYASDNSTTWLAPLWIIALWLIFATTLTASLSWLQGRYLLAAALGAIAGPLAYIAGERFQALFLHENWLTAVITLAVIWAVVLPLLAWLAKQLVPEA
ncbi:MAG: DUF2878 domain-containing protein [Chloroflexota bacterium]